MLMKLTSPKGTVLFNTAHVTAVTNAGSVNAPYKSRLYVNACEADSWFQALESPEQIWDMMEKEALLQQRLRRPLWKIITDRLGLTTI